MTQYKQLTDAEKEKVFATDVLGWVLDEYGDYRTSDGIGFVSYSHPDHDSIQEFPLFRPLRKENIFHAMLGVEKLLEDWDTYTMEKDSDGWIAGFTPFDTDGDWPFSECCKTLNEAIVEACIRIKRPDLFEETK